MMNAGVIAVLIGVALVVYFTAPLLWIRFLNVTEERLALTLGAVLIAWGVLYLSRRPARPAN